MIWQHRRYWLPVALTLLGLLLLARVFFADGLLQTTAEADVVLLVAILSIVMIVAVHTLVRISISYLRLRTVQQVRRETLAEHRRFLSRLDHELKNPLTALRAGLQTLMLTPLDEQQQHIVNTMGVETSRLSRLVADLRKLAELEVQPLNLQAIDLHNFVQNIVQIERERFDAGERLLTSVVEGSQDRWVGDEDLLALAVHNLLDNAYKYSQPGDSVRVDVAAQQSLTICVSDSGIGIPEDAIPHVWEELYRAQPLEKIPGSGTGLALVKAIVERHEGVVKIESERGRGTSVYLHLPALALSSHLQ